MLAASATNAEIKMTCLPEPAIVSMLTILINAGAINEHLSRLRAQRVAAQGSGLSTL